MNTRPRRTALLTTVVAGPLALALVACGGSDNEVSDDLDDVVASTTTSAPAPATTDTDDDTDDDTAAPSPTATPEPAPADATGDQELIAAARTALGAVGGSTLFTVDRDNGGWEVSVVAADGTESDVSVSADGTQITRGPDVDRDDSDDTDDLSERQQLLRDASVKFTAALTTARAEAPGATVDSIDLELEAGRATWDVQLGEDTADERTVIIDAVTGDVLRVEIDD